MSAWFTYKPLRWLKLHTTINYFNSVKSKIVMYRKIGALKKRKKRQNCTWISLKKIFNQSSEKIGELGVNVKILNFCEKFSVVILSRQQLIAFIHITSHSFKTHKK